MRATHDKYNRIQVKKKGRLKEGPVTDNGKVAHDAPEGAVKA